MNPNSNTGARQMPDYSPNNYHGSYYGSGSPETDHPPPQYAPPGQAPTGTRQQYPSPSGVPSYAPSSSPTYNKSQAIPGAHSSYTGPYPASPGPSRHTSHAESYQAFPGRPASSTGAYSASRSPHTSDTGPYPRRSALPSTFTPENSAYYSPRDVGLHADASQPTGYDHQWQSGPSLRDPPLRSRDPDYPRQEYGSPPDKKPVPARSDRPPADASNAIAVSKPTLQERALRFVLSLNQPVHVRITANFWAMGVIVGVITAASKLTGWYWVEFEVVEGARTERVFEENLRPRT